MVKATLPELQCQEGVKRRTHMTVDVRPREMGLLEEMAYASQLSRPATDAWWNGTNGAPDRIASLLV